MDRDLQLLKLIAEREGIVEEHDRLVSRLKSSHNLALMAAVRRATDNSHPDHDDLIKFTEDCADASKQAYETMHRFNVAFAAAMDQLEARLKDL